MKRVLAVLVALACGCGPRTETVYSAVLRESALVYDVAYVPSGHGSGSGVGLTGGGDLAVTSTSVHIPARWAVVFECQHGRFVIDGEAVYNKVRRGDEVTVAYREKYEDVYDDAGARVVERRLVDLDFIGVEP